MYEFCVAARVTGIAVLLLLAAAGARSQDAAAAPDGTKARSALSLQADHVTISVANIQTEQSWYIQKLGFGFPPGPQNQPKDPKLKAAHLVIPGFRLDLMQYEGSQRATTPSPIFLEQGFIHLAFTVPDLEASYSFLKAAGTDVNGERNEAGKLGVLLIHDPEGNELEIFGR